MCAQFGLGSEHQNLVDGMSDLTPSDGDEEPQRSPTTGRRLAASRALFVLTLIIMATSAVHKRRILFSADTPSNTGSACSTCKGMFLRNNRNFLAFTTQRTWSHATNTVQELTDALDGDSDVTAIEADVLMGHYVNDDETSEPRPIMSHPPVRTSDLTLKQFLSLSTGGGVKDTEDEATTSTTRGTTGRRVLLKDIKLDLKELKTLPHIFSELEDLGPFDPNGKVIYLHKDILPGPGRRSTVVHFDIREFFQTCLDGIENLMEKNYADVPHDQRPKFAFSLAHMVDNRYPEGYTIEDMTEFLNILKRYNITNQSMGIAYSPNARLLLKDFGPMDYLMNRLPLAEIVAWTGHGEPAISQTKINQISTHFIQQGTIDRVSFDCQMTSNYAIGLATDTFVKLQGTCLFGWKGFKELIRIKF